MMFSVIVRGRLLLGALLLGSVYSFASPVLAACDVVGSYKTTGGSFFECSSSMVNIEFNGPTGIVTLDDFLLDPPSNGYVRILADDTELNPTDITVNITGDTSITSPDYDGVDVRTVRGDIELNIGEDTSIDAAQTAVFVESTDPNGGPSYVGGNVVINNYGQVTAGPDGGVMGSNGIVGRSNAGGVSISNYGTVTTTRTEFTDAWDTYGILADGGYKSPSPVEVSIYNDGTISALNDAMRVNSYNGVGKVVNDVNGVVTSSGRRGVVVWSDTNVAELENYGSISALDGTGANVWGTTGSSLLNSGAIYAYDNPSATGGASTFAGVHLWTQGTGDSVLQNTVGGRIDARDGFGVWMQSTNGDVIIDNAGVIKGEYNAVMVTADGITTVDDTSTLEAYKGAQHGAIKLTNSGLLTAYGLAEDGIEKRALVTLTGTDLGPVALTNLEGGTIGAGLDLSNGFDEGLLDGSADELTQLSPALKNSAVMIAANTTHLSTSLTNDGTILGRINTGSINRVLGVGPSYSNPDLVFNNGLWATSGSSMMGTLFNTGIIWAQGQTTFVTGVRNSGQLVIAASADEAAKLTIAQEYMAESPDADSYPVIAFDIGRGAALSDDLLLDIGTTATAVTHLQLRDMGGWDWQDGPRDVIAARNGGDGEGSFVLDTPYFGLAAYTLAYRNDDGDIWSLDGSLNTQATADIGAAAGDVAATLTDITAGVRDRADELRDLFQADDAVEPSGYAATPDSPMNAALAALQPDPAPTLRTWAKAGGGFGSGDSRDVRQGNMLFGADITAALDDTLLAAGVFGAMSGSGVDFASGNTADIRAQAVGVYGTAMLDDGLFVSGVYGVERASTDLAIYGEPAQFDAQLHGGRVDVGYRAQLDDLSVEPSVGLRFGRVSYDDFTMSNTTVRTDDTDTYGAEARLRVSRTFVADGIDLTPFAIFTLGKGESSGGDIIVDGSGLVDTVGDTGLYGGVSAGVAASSADGRFNGFARADSKLTDGMTWAALKLGGSVSF